MEEFIELTYRRPQPPVNRLERLQQLKLEVMANNPRITGISVDPNNFNPRNGILTRYGKKLLEEGAKYYGGYRATGT